MKHWERAAARAKAAAAAIQAEAQAILEGLGFRFLGSHLARLASRIAGITPRTHSVKSATRAHEANYAVKLPIVSIVVPFFA